jgi:hypothetical protein
VLRETTSRGLCGLVCPSRTSERGGEGDCVKGGGGGEGERERGVLILCTWLLIYIWLPSHPEASWGKSAGCERSSAKFGRGRPRDSYTLQCRSRGRDVILYI